jgi:hypothetical protein
MTDQAVKQMEYLRFEFPGIDSKGHCFIRAWICPGRLVVLCSQLIDYQGTSITNAFEQIAERVIQVLDKDVGLARCLPPIPWWQFWRNRNVAFSEVFPKTVWIDHYPAGQGINPQGSYQLVRLDDRYDPHWTTVSLEQAANLAGLPVQSLTINPQLLR